MLNMYDIEQAIRDAETTLSSADAKATRMARMLKGRLRHVDPLVLADLKRELQSFNSTTKEWKS